MSALNLNEDASTNVQRLSTSADAQVGLTSHLLITL